MYIIQEIQTADTRVPAFLPPVVKDNPFEAESEFYIKTGYAAISTVWEHTIVMYTETGTFCKAKCYKHTPKGTTVVTDEDSSIDDGSGNIISDIIEGIGGIT